VRVFTFSSSRSLIYLHITNDVPATLACDKKWWFSVCFGLFEISVKLLSVEFLLYQGFSGSLSLVYLELSFVQIELE
jgi:hypothetical protein